MDSFNFYQKHYFHELERKAQITNSLSIPVGVLSLLCGVLGFYVSDFHFSLQPIPLVFPFLLLCSAIVIVLTVYFLFRSYWSYTYRYISNPDELLTFQKDLEKYYQSIGNNNPVDHALTEFEETLIRKYSNSATQNAINNDNKSSYLHKANSSLVWLVALVFLCTPIFFWNKNTVSKMESKYNIINNSGDNQMAKDSKDTPQEKPAEKPTNVEKPKEPPDKIMREGDEGKKRNH
jgi:hypothetical protein